ncbi:hypothetical protein RHGRI_014628 [Rhododendron griersonianum]|uniref:DUF4283 domain-containing protein n=1 Tax=Rhododendron griersonianum TaxID=479676 RepID=A0AAV6KA25_9ERIC|nr:hypothetical protein RHGRI_014628 [Rhododendron griersonianum]
MSRVVSMKSLKTSFSLVSNVAAQFRALGGRSVLITFQSQEVRDDLIKHPWMERWFEGVKPWSGEPASVERFVRLSCQGVPLNGWNATTFKQIGEIWGSFVSVEEATLKDLSFANGKVLITTKEVRKIESWIQLDVQGVQYDVRIVEDFSFSSPDDVEGCTPTMFEDLKPREKISVVESIGSSSGEKEDEDDDVEAPKRDPPRERERGSGSMGQDNIGVVAGLHGMDKDFAGVLDAKADEHLMPKAVVVQMASEGFESFVRDSVGLEVVEGLGRMSNGPEIQELGQEAEDSGRMVGHDNVGYTSVIRGNELGRESPGVVPDSLSPSQVLVVHLGDNQMEGDTDLIRDDLRGVEAIEREEGGLLVPRSPQVPQINLVVDLNNPACRKRRRRQRSNLLSLCEGELSGNSVNPAASQGEPIQRNALIFSEVQATMAIGGKLNIHFNSDDEIFLRKMIEIETQENALMPERARP